MTPTPYSRDGVFFFPVRVYYEDTDAAGVVYYANYLKYAERARTEWLRSAGIEQDTMLRETGLGFVVSKAEVRYRSPARLDALLWVETRLQELGKVRMSMRQIIRANDAVCAELGVEIVCVNRDFAPQKLEGSLRETFARML